MVQAAGLFSDPARSAAGVCAAFQGNGPIAVFSSFFRRPRYLIAASLLICAVMATGTFMSRRHPATPELAFSEFLQQVQAGHVKQVRFADGALSMTLADGSKATTLPPPSYL